MSASVVPQSRNTSPARWLGWTALLLIFGVAGYRLVRLHSGIRRRSVDLRSVTLEGLSGRPISAATFSGKALLVNFWAPWCPPCRMEIPWLQHVQDREAGKLLVLGVVADPSQYDKAEKFMHARGVTYLLLRESPSLEAALGGISALPTSHYIAPSGALLHVVHGLIPEALMTRYAADATKHE